ncbi:hypothetical protein MAR_027178 [Mya arenaria]|uniref:Uncharacterized protein n=1 Tax=Mya arenaria TaxID=6604 RepID=A0ABY7EWU8_MYAAR|nr:hypothetical protein MAR_027178 [Mya arenaria]
MQYPVLESIFNPGNNRIDTNFHMGAILQNNTGNFVPIHLMKLEAFYQCALWLYIQWRGRKQDLKVTVGAYKADLTLIEDCVTS